MDAELEKLVESGKLTTKAAEKLEQLRPGSFCLHKSWGFGQVAEWNLLLNQIVIDFKTKAKHPMQLAYAAENRIRRQSFATSWKGSTAKPPSLRSARCWWAICSPRQNGSGGGRTRRRR